MKKINLKKIFKRIFKNPMNVLLAIFLIFTFSIGTIYLGIKISSILIIILSLFSLIIKKIRHGIKKDPKKKKKWKKIKNILLILILIFSILGIIGAGFFAYYIVQSAPDFEEEKLYTQDTSIVYDSEGNVIAKLGREKRQKITFEQMPQVLIDAIVATEDSRYFQHNGFDLPRFAKASAGQLMGNSSAGGGSTLTMQVVKNTLTSVDQNILRKFTDIYLSIFVLEKKYTKEEIFELYVNIPFLGANAYGVEEASQTYFNKHVNELNLSEAALLAGLFQSPSSYNPYVYPERAEKRRATVLYLMQLHGYITEEERRIAKSIPVTELLAHADDESLNSNPYQSFVDAVVKEVQENTKLNPYDTPMKIYTTMLKTKQDALNTAVLNTKFKDDVVQTGIAVTDTNTGAVVAIFGGRNKKGERTFNYATDIKKHIGSTAKPIYDYGPGIEYFNWNELKYFKDEKWSYSDGVNVNNWDGKYIGDTNLKIALGLSRNIPALKAFQEIGPKKSLEFALKLGMSPEISGNTIYETHSVGAYVGENPVKMAAAYAAFGNGGFYIKPYTITKISYINTGKEDVFKPTKKEAMSDSTAFMITDVLVWAVNEGLSGDAKVSGVEVAAKSGTTNYDKETMAKYKMPSAAINDLWMVAYTKSYSLAIWYGYDKISNANYSKRGDSKVLIQNVSKAIFTEKGDKFTTPSSVKQFTVEKDSNPLKLPSPFTPESEKVTGWFKIGTEPTEVSSKYNALNNVTGLSGDISGTTVTLKWNHTISESLNTYLSNNVSTVGTIGFNVYKKTSTGTLTFLGFTQDKEYTVLNVNSATTFVVKTTYSLSRTTESSGNEITVTPPLFTINLAGSANMTISLGSTFIDPSLIVKDLQGATLSESSYILTKMIKDKTTSEIYQENTFINTKGTYEITYNVKYLDVTLTTKRTVIVN